MIHKNFSANEQENYDSDGLSDDEESVEESAEEGQFVAFRINFMSILQLIFYLCYSFILYVRWPCLKFFVYIYRIACIA